MRVIARGLPPGPAAGRADCKHRTATPLSDISPEQLRALLESMNVGFILLDPDYHILGINAETQRVDGRSYDALSGRSCWDAWPALTTSAFGTLIRDAMEKREGHAMPIRCDEAVFGQAWLDMRVHPWGDGVAVFFRDVTERRRAEIELAATQERYQLAARATNDIIWDWDIVANDIGWNAAAADIFGSSPALPSSAIEDWAERIHPDDRARITASLDDAVAGNSSYWSAEYRMRRGGGDYRTVFDRGFIIRDEAGRATRAVGAMLDVTDIRRSEQHVQQLQSELIHVSRLSAMGAMASTLAHELNQPLTAVSSYLSGCRRLLDGGDPDAVERMRRGLEGARASALRAGDVIRRLRAMIERGEVQRTEVPLGAAVAEALALAMVGEDRELRPEVSIPSDLCVEGDPIQLQQVVLNLVRNAVQAMEGRDLRRLSIAAERKGRDVLLSVADTGRGIDAAALGTIFEPFHSTREDGMGIGLSISRTIVEAHRGRIWAEANASGGATFSVLLPAQQPRLGLKAKAGQA